MKNILIAVVAVLVFNAMFVYSGGLALLMKTEQEEVMPVRVQTNIVDVFRFTVEEEVQKKIGMPIEGYEPQMFLEVFPGLAETDFDGVQASVGHYEIQDGRLVHELDPQKLTHSAGTITDVVSALIAQER